jgi:transcriptional regulator with XRE-family HTH domain
MTNEAPEAAEARFRAGLCERLIWTRKLHHHSQIRVAEVLGINANNWTRYESGTREMDLRTLAAFCEHYEVDPRWLLLGDIYALGRHLRVALLSAFPEARKYLVEPGAAPSGGPGGESQIPSDDPPSDNPGPAPRRALSASNL